MAELLLQAFEATVAQKKLKTAEVQSANDVTDAVVVPVSTIAHEAKRRRLEDKDALTDQEVATCVKNEFTLMSAAASGGVLGAISRLEAKMVTKQDMDKMIEIMSYNQRGRIVNNRAELMESKLSKLMKENGKGQQPLGAMPQADLVPFPKTREDLFKLANAELKKLADFYQEDFGDRSTPLPARIMRFAAFIGTKY